MLRGHERYLGFAPNFAFSSDYSLQRNVVGPVHFLPNFTSSVATYDQIFTQLNRHMKSPEDVRLLAISCGDSDKTIIIIIIIIIITYITNHYCLTVGYVLDMVGMTTTR